MKNKTIYAYFGFQYKEELYRAVRLRSSQVASLIEFINFLRRRVYEKEIPNYRHYLSLVERILEWTKNL